MKKKINNIILISIITICFLAGIAFLVLACCYFRFDYLFMSILCIGIAIYYIVSDFNNCTIKNLITNALARLIACYIIYFIVSLFFNFSINCNKPIYTYKYYQKNKPNLITEIFPDYIPESAKQEHLYIVEQGFMQGSPFVKLFFYADAETIENYSTTYSLSCLASGYANSTYNYNESTHSAFSLNPHLPEEIKDKETDFYIYYMEIPDGYSDHIAIVAINKTENFVFFYDD